MEQVGESSVRRLRQSNRNAQNMGVKIQHSNNMPGTIHTNHVVHANP